MKTRLWHTGALVLIPCIPLACSAGGDSSPDGYGGSSATGGAAGNAGAAGATGSSGDSGASGSGAGGAVGGTGGLGGSGGMGGSGGIGATGGVAGNAGNAGVGGTGGGPPDIPTPTGTCPEFQQGDVTFNPPGGARRAAITMGANTNGPLIFYWHATTSNPAEARRGLPINEVTAAGGVVVAPYDVANAGTFPWLSNQPQHDALFDEVLACAVQKTQIDTSRIHSIGFSAGALMTTHLAHARSKYMASVATYSGGGTGPYQEPNNKFAVMMMTGGPNDMVVVNFHTSSQQWQTELKARGSLALFCNHGGGHTIPTRLVPGVWQFFKDHPYGRSPSPYVGNIPSGIAPPCVE